MLLKRFTESCLVAIFVAFLAAQTGLCQECSQPLAECGSSPHKECCNLTNYKCVGIDTGRELTASNNDGEFGTCECRDEDSCPQ